MKEQFEEDVLPTPMNHRYLNGTVEFLGFDNETGFYRKDLPNTEVNALRA